MEKLKILGITFSALFFLVSSCTKTGPAGPTGVTGATGATGATGVQGPQGPAGTANVIYSAWFTPAAYTVTTVFGIVNLDYIKPAAGITQSILDNGAVLTYGKLNGYNASLWPTDQVGKLPILINYQIGTNTNIDTWSAYATVGDLRINLVSSLNAYTSDAAINHSHSFRYIIIPGGVAGARQASPGVAGTGYSLEQLRSMSYEQVCRILSIPE
jgi:hypothetical protein